MASAAERPVAALFAGLVGQDKAVLALRAHARNPVHAYLFQGPGALTRHAARAFAAALLCPAGGDGICEHCRRALAGTHPDLVVVERAGPLFGVEEARRLAALASRHPLETARQVIVVADVHLALRSAPALLKTVEEPPPTTVFVLLAEGIPPELVTVASRCVVIPFPPVPSLVIAEWLTTRGVEPRLASLVADSCQGDLDRAQLLVEDESFVARQELWRTVPGRLDGTGAVAAELALALQAATDAALEPLRARHAEELEVLAEAAEAVGDRPTSGRKALSERQAREERRWRSDELRAGLGVLARAYRERLADAAQRTSPAARSPGRGDGAAVTLITGLAESLIRNPNELLQLEALLVRLGRLDV
jgi:DNA polymerase III subunit delta'